MGNLKTEHTLCRDLTLFKKAYIPYDSSNIGTYIAPGKKKTALPFIWLSIDRSCAYFDMSRSN